MKRSVLALAMACLAPLSSQAAGADVRFGKVEWTRLITPSRYWNRHAESDGRLLSFIADNTPLVIEKRWQGCSAKDLEQLCRYPFVYAHDVSALTVPEAANLAEYMKRGGFVLIDFCANTRINPPPHIFLQRQLDVLRPHLPGLRVSEVPAHHEVFSVYFKMRHFPPQTRPGDSRWVDVGTNPMQALYLGERMIGMVGLSAFQCAWGGVGSHDNAVECMQMLGNIYIYAMTH